MSKVRVIFIIAMIFLQIYSSQSFISASQYDQLATELDWMKKCLLVQPALYKSCNEYVDDNGVLTTEGERAVVCIRDGANWIKIFEIWTTTSIGIPRTRHVNRDERM